MARTRYKVRGLPMCDPATRPDFIPVPDTVRVRMVYNYGSNVYMNVLHFKKAGAVASDVSALVDEVKTQWETFIKPIQTSVVTLAFIEGTLLNTASDAQITIPVNEPGTGSSEALPFGASIVIKFTAGLTGRSNRGRLYHIGLTELQTTGNGVDDAAATTIITAYQNFFTALANTTDFIHVVVSYCNNNVWRAEGNAVDVLFYLLTDKNIDS